MTKPQLNYAASTYVFRLLGRGRARAQRTPGSALDETLETLRDGGKSALIEVELGSGSLGRLLVQVGRLIFAQRENSSGEKALAEIRQGAGDAHLYTLELSDEQIIFACAALAGIPLALGETLSADPEQVPALLGQLSQQNFTGVVALEQGLQTLVWRFQRGRVLNTVKLPQRIRSGRLTQIVWQEQMLSEVGGTEPGDAQPPAEATTVQPVQPSARPVRHTMTRNTQVQGTQPGNTQVQGTQTQGTQTQGTQVRTIYFQNTQIPSTYVPNTAAHNTSVRDPSAQDTSAQNTAVQNTAVQKTTVRSTAHSASGQSAPVQNATGQNVAVQNVTGQKTALSQTHFGSSRQSKRQEVSEGTEEVWERFQSVLRAQLGSRAERVFGLMYTELGGFPRAELVERLTPQVERIAGSAAARTFRDGL